VTRRVLEHARVVAETPGGLDMSIEPHPPHALTGGAALVTEHLVHRHGASFNQLAHTTGAEVADLHDQLHRMGAASDAAAGREPSSEDLLAQVGRRMDRLDARLDAFDARLVELRQLIVGGAS